MSPGARAELYFQIYAARGCTLPELATLLAEVGVEQASLATLRRYSSTYRWSERRQAAQEEERRRSDA